MKSLFPSISRRQLLTLLASSPLWLKSHNALAERINPQRVAALEWLPVELLIALGVTPYGVADIPNYRRWVNEPTLPDSVIDLGLRTEPNLELLASMKPSLIVWSAGYGPSASKLARIAPGQGFTFTDGKRPLDMARHSLVQMAELLDMQQAAQTHLENYDKFIGSLKPRFAHRGKRPVLLMSLLESHHALVLGNNSLFQQVLEPLGIENAWHGEMTFWGSAIVGIERLADIRDADVLCFGHGDDATAQAIINTPLWKSMPFVRQNRFHLVPAVWFYGATLSAMHFGRVLSQTLGGHK
ncbi:Fe(3+)-hydroxamate ABC transporter substrate-binding protein FhuD [Mangrovibacter yixingensis]|uniref:Fe(3+)-hydroxamate ABC transporter substrate-binding protein FhuD n=1 Tax=Mangrovibacter yixingensis TaxID=1529639 RepID=UPI001CFD8792|nr:Fe(3+)-hydroxamate ABC transporter substrate-binding protein FhuD [Mangrovibacter yixingensis]